MGEYSIIKFIYGVDWHVQTGSIVNFTQYKRCESKVYCKSFRKKALLSNCLKHQYRGRIDEESQERKIFHELQCIKLSPIQDLVVLSL